MAAHKPAPRTGQDKHEARLPLVAAPRLVPAAGYRATLRSVLVGPSVTPRIMHSPEILVFDSGVGGLTVFREIARARPDARFVYAADDALFPYGKAPESRAGRARRRADGRADRSASARPRGDRLQHRLDAGAARAARALHALPFVGTVPAIKPACAASQSKRVSVLGTEATVAREYTHALIRNFGQGCDVTLVGSARLATLAEAALAGEPVDDAAIRAEIAPCFVEDGASAPTRSCSPARTIRCCSTASSGSRPGRCAGSIRRRRSRAAWSNCSARATGAPRSGAGARDLHLGPQAVRRPRCGACRFRPRAGRVRPQPRDLTPPPFTA